MELKERASVGQLMKMALIWWSVLRKVFPSMNRTSARLCSIYICLQSVVVVVPAGGSSHSHSNTSSILHKPLCKVSFPTELSIRVCWFQRSIFSETVRASKWSRKQAEIWNLENGIYSKPVHSQMCKVGRRRQQKRAQRTALLSKKMLPLKDIFGKVLKRQIHDTVIPHVFLFYFYFQWSCGALAFCTSRILGFRRRSILTEGQDRISTVVTPRQMKSFHVSTLKQTLMHESEMRKPFQTVLLQRILQNRLSITSILRL